MSDNNRFRKPLPKTALSEYKLRLEAPAPEGGTRKPSLAFSVAKNQPRISVYTNIESDRNRGMVIAKMDTPTFFGFLQLLRNVIEGESDTKYSIENKEHTFFNGERSREPKVTSTTVVGKDREGRVFIGVVAKNITPIKFIFGPTDYHHLVHKDGTPFTQAELSVLYAKGYLELLHNLIPSVLDTHYTEPEPRNNNRGGGGGGGNYNRGGGGNYNRGGGNRGGGNQQRAQREEPAGGDDDWGGDVTDDFPM